jgi:hypothetical protein
MRVDFYDQSGIYVVADVMIGDSEDPVWFAVDWTLTGAVLCYFRVMWAGFVTWVMPLFHEPDVSVRHVVIYQMPKTGCATNDLFQRDPPSMKIKFDTLSVL